MNKIEREFLKRDHIEQEFFLKNTWCNSCNEADLGLIDPHEFESDGKIFIEGKCVNCGSVVISEIIENEIDG